VVSMSTMFNFWRYAGDGLHVVGVLVLLVGIIRHASARTVSLRSQVGPHLTHRNGARLALGAGHARPQELYLLVYVTRYTDLFGNSPLMYNNVLKVQCHAATDWS
jgi:hypothetical protein